jgi:hypothetical protein
MAKKESVVGEVEINNAKELKEKLAEIVNDENKPSDEEVEEKQKEFEEASRDFSVKSWNIGEPEDAQANVDYLNHFVRNRLFWTKTGWMGVIKMNEELKDAESFIQNNPGCCLQLGYQALEFIFYSFQNPGGVGLQTAQDLEQDREIYSKMFDSIGDRVTEAREQLKEIQILQDQYAAMAQGFYLEIEDGVEEIVPTEEELVEDGDTGDPPTEE